MHHRIVRRAAVLTAVAATIGVLTAVAGPADAVPAGFLASGRAVPQLTLPRHQTDLVWSSEFNGVRGSQPNGRNWQLETGGGGWGNNELEAYTARRKNVHETGTGLLHIIARREQYTDHAGEVMNYTSARLMSYRSFKYGYLVARVRVPIGAGLWPAFWTLGADIRHHVSWPATGEIDIMESIDAMRFVAGSLHGTDSAAEYPWQDYTVTDQLDRTAHEASQWHTYGVDWTSHSITFYCDGKAYETVQKSQLPANDVWEFSKRHVVLLNLAVGGNWPGDPNSTTGFPAVMKVDWVRLYRRP